ncbi:MAG: hypothetical protein JW795_12615 [Chitinivibrionales bacterium]|nr:hypothetical protein [Chitinivibrionales bacterium]
MKNIHTHHISALLFVLGIFLTLIFTTCSQRPSPEELSRLQEASSAADAAQQKLTQLRIERMTLEKQLKEKTDQLQQHEKERDELKNKN